VTSQSPSNCQIR